MTAAQSQNPRYRGLKPNPEALGVVPLEEGEVSRPVRVRASQAVLDWVGGLGAINVGALLTAAYEAQQVNQEEAPAVRGRGEEQKGDLMTIVPQSATVFDQLRQTHSDGREFWSARDLMPVLGYDTWRNFAEGVERARAVCDHNQHDSREHFVAASKMVKIGSKAGRDVLDYHLTRYACYLTAMNGDSRKPEIAAAQNYFVVQTRRAEIQQAQAMALSSDPVLAQLQAMMQIREAQLVTEKQVAVQGQQIQAFRQELDQSPIQGQQVSTIFRLGQQLGQRMGGYALAWRVFKNHFNLASYRDLPRSQFEAGVRFLQLQISSYGGETDLGMGEL